MPFKKKTTRKYTRKRRVVKKKKSLGIVNFSSGVRHGLGPHGRIKFGSQLEGVFGNGVSIDDIGQVQANSCIDPWSSLGSAQPPFFDCLLTSNGPFLRYRVTGVKFSVSIVNLAAAPARAFLYISDAATDMSLMSSYMLQSNNLVTSTVITPSGGAKDMVTLTKTYNFSKIYGRKVITDNDYQAGYNASPSDLIYIYFGLQSLNGSAVSANWSANMIQYTRLEDVQTGGEGITLED